SAQQDAVEVGQPVEEDAQQVARAGGDGSDDPQSQAEGDGAGDEGKGEQLDGVGDELLVQPLEPGRKGHGADDGDDAGGVVARRRHGDGDHEQAVVHVGRRAQHIGVDHGRADNHAFKLGQAELFGGGVGQDDGHEVEEAVAQGVQDVVGGAGAVQHAQRHEQGQKALDDAAGGQNAQPGGKDAGDDADEGVDGVELALGRVAAALDGRA